MQIIDKNGYLDSALKYIEKGMLSGRGLQKTAKKTRIDEGLLKSLSLRLSDFSEKQFFTNLQEKIEYVHGFTPGAEVQISGADVSIENKKGKAIIAMNLICDIVIDGEQEDKIKINMQIG